MECARYESLNLAIDKEPGRSQGACRTKIRSVFQPELPDLNDILHGGLARGFLYLIEGNPGAGKTTLALQFLIEGASKGEKGLYLSLAESESELHHVAASHGFSLDKITLCKIAPPELAGASGQQQYTVFQPAEVELADVLETILARVRELSPARVVIDSMSELRMLARDSLRYRRQILALKQFFEGRDCTTLLLDERFRDNQESQVQTIAHGVISLEVIQRDYGTTRRRLEVLKVRASSFREGFHDYVIDKGGIRVFPRLVSGEYRDERGPTGSAPQRHRGTRRLFQWRRPTRYQHADLWVPPAAANLPSARKFVVPPPCAQEHGAIFTFDETRQSFWTAAAAWAWNLEPYVENKTIHLEQVDPAELSPGEFIDRIRHGVENATGESSLLTV